MAELVRLMVGEIPALRRYARALVGDPTQADDLVQDCLERAWSRSHLLRAEKDMRVWLFTILHNLYVNAVRQHNRQPVVMPLTDQVERLSVGGAQEASVEIADVSRALTRIQADQAAAVLLVGVEEMSYREAAAVLDIPVGTLMSRLHRGRKRLIAVMAGETRARLKRVK